MRGKRWIGGLLFHSIGTKSRSEIRDVFGEKYSSAVDYGRVIKDAVKGVFTSRFITYMPPKLWFGTDLGSARHG
jgi:hypothetical protein